MIKTSDIATYLSTIAEQASRKPATIIAIEAKNVTTHEVSFNGFVHLLTYAERKIENAIDRICNQIEWATDQPSDPVEEPITAYDLVDEWSDDALFEDNLAKMEADNGIDSVTVPESLFSIENSPMEWVHAQLLTANAWEVFDAFKNTIFASPASAMICYELLQNGNHMEKNIPALNEMAMAIVAEARLQLVNTKPVSGQRPADIYRRFVKALVWVKDHIDFGTRADNMEAKMVYRDVLEAQSYPFSELDSPDWVDPFTGIIDVEAKEDRFKMTVEKGEESMSYTEGFDCSDDLDVEISEDDTRAVEEKAWQAVSHEHSPTEQVGALKSEAYPWIKACRKTVNEYMQLFRATAPKYTNANGYNQKVDPDIYAVMSTKVAFAASPEKRDFMEFIQGVALTYEPEDIATVFLSVQNGLMFAGIETEDTDDLEWPAEAYQIITKDGTSLGDWLDENGDVLMDQIHDYAGHGFEPDQIFMDGYCNRTLKLIVKEAKIEARQDAKKAIAEKRNINFLISPEFMEGFLTAACNSRTLTTKDANGVFTNIAVEAGKNAWREAQSAEGNKAFHKAIKEGKDAKVAWAVFYAARNKADKKLDGIAGLDAKGLTLKSGRHIDFGIACLKMKGGEFEFEGDERARIKTALVARKVGLVFANLL